jgi:hypothetical protein
MMDKSLNNTNCMFRYFISFENMTALHHFCFFGSYLSLKEIRGKEKVNDRMIW